MRNIRSKIHRGSSSLIIVAVLIAAISQLPAAKLSNGRQGQAADGSFISATVNGRTFSHRLNDPPTSNESAEAARDALVALIDDDVEFMAQITTAPPGVFESNDVFYEVLTQFRDPASSHEMQME